MKDTCFYDYDRYNFLLSGMVFHCSKEDVQDLESVGDIYGFIEKLLKTGVFIMPVTKDAMPGIAYRVLTLIVEALHSEGIALDTLAFHFDDIKPVRITSILSDMVDEYEYCLNVVRAYI